MSEGFELPAVTFNTTINHNIEDDDVTLDRDVARHALEFVRLRPEDQVHKNFLRNSKLLEDFYLDRHDGVTKAEFDEKVARFEDMYKKELFPYVIHAPGLFEHDSEIELKSAVRLSKDAKERGEEKDFGWHQGPIDRALGNDDLIFANLYPFVSRSSGGDVYQIDSKDGWVASVDIADSKPFYSEDVHNGRAPRIDSKEQFENQLITYADNLYTIADFEKFFSQFCAAFFDSPEVAVRTLDKVGGWNIAEASFWSEHSVQWKSEDLEDPQSFIQIREFFKETGVVPPIVPEYQFKDSVSARWLGNVTQIPIYPGFKPLPPKGPPPFPGMPIPAGIPGGPPLAEQKKN